MSPVFPRATGQWPVEDSGPASAATGETWGGISMALSKRQSWPADGLVPGAPASRSARGAESQGASALDRQANPSLGQRLPLRHRPLADGAIGPGRQGTGLRRNLGGDQSRARLRTPRAARGTVAGPAPAPGPLQTMTGLRRRDGRKRNERTSTFCLRLRACSHMNTSEIVENEPRAA
jgi:hypothetical protein